MRQTNIDALIKRLAGNKASAYIRSDHAESLWRPKGAASDAGAASGFPKIRKGSAPEAVLDLRLCFATGFAAGKPVIVAKQQSASPTLKPIPPRLRKFLPHFTESELDAVCAAQPEILRWIGNSEQKAKRFFDNPVAAMKDAGIDLDPVLLKKIEQQRSRAQGNNFKTDANIPRARIRSIKVQVPPKED